MKEMYVQRLLAVSTALAQALSEAQSLTDTYFDRGYGSGGANELTTDDLVVSGLAPGHIAAGITLFQQLQALRSGLATTPADYDATLNQLRRDL